MNKRKTAMGVKMLYVCVYAAALLYVIFCVINTIPGAKTAEGIALPLLAFEALGFVNGAFVLWGHACGKKRLDAGDTAIATGATLVYTVVLHVLCLLCAGALPQMLFVLLNVMLLFVYYLFTCPVLISAAGTAEEEK